MNDAPKLLVEWSSPWQDFISAIRPALSKSPTQLAGEARTGLFPYRGMLLSWIVEGLVLAAVIILPAKFAAMRPYEPLPAPKYDIIYYSGDELPRTEDLGGAQTGKSGRAGGQEAHHRSQTIRVARGESLREKVVDAPKLNLPKSDAAVANLLAYKPIPGPPPAEGLKSSRQVPTVPQSVTPPTPEVSRDQLRAAPALNAAIIPPAPAALQRDLNSMRAPGSRQTDVIPPPVSAPERITNLNPKLTLPAQTIIAPPPQVSRDLAAAGPGSGPGELQKQIVPPPVQIGTTAGTLRSSSGLGNTTVVPPPVQLGSGALQSKTVAGLGTAIVPPPPTVGGAGSLAGRGTGSKGGGLGGPLDVGDIAVAPSKNAGGSGGGSGIVVSSQPGSKVGVPGGGGAGSLAMSPAGGTQPGLGGSGGGTGIGHGNGPGSGFSGEGPGAAREGTGRGSDTLAKGGISPYPGPGGAGSGTGGKPAVPGVSVHGGNNNIVTLPSFDPNGSAPSDPPRSSQGKDKPPPGITVVATSRSGGAFNFYGALKGDRVYTVYLETALGTAVMQFADPTSLERPYAEDLTAPQAIRADLPGGLKPARLVIACILDTTGGIRRPQVLEPGPAELTAKVLAALRSWKFRPAFRGEQPVEVNAILGFGIDTR